MVTSRADTSSHRLGFWLLWLIASTTGFAISQALLYAILSAMQRSEIGINEGVDLPSIALTSVIVGAAVGGAQWLVLRHHLDRAAWWVPASAAGFAVAGVVSLSVERVATGLGMISIPVAQSLVLGFLVGLAQWPILQWQVPRAGLWILASMVSFGAGGLAGSFAIGSLPRLEATPALTVFVAAAVSGVILTLLLNDSEGVS